MTVLHGSKPIPGPHHLISHWIGLAGRRWSIVIRWKMEK